MLPATATTPGSGLELLERSLGYTRAALAEIRAEHMTAPTPCVGWDLRRLLAHMDDALDAFLEASHGAVRMAPVATPGDPVESVRRKACALLGAWLSDPPPSVVMGDRQLAAEALLDAAALEIAVHGWDVSCATGAARPIPADLARGLFPLARALVTPADRGSRFGPDLTLIRSGAPPTHPEQRLLAFLGRLSGPPGGNPPIPPTRGAQSP